MIASKEARNSHEQFQFGDVRPSHAAHEELWWFFNDAEKELAPQSGYGRLLFDTEPTALGKVERRADAMHSAEKIRLRLQALPAFEAQMLEALYTQRRWSVPLRRALGVLAGPVAALPIVRAERLAAKTTRLTTQLTAEAWLEERIARGGAVAVTIWSDQAESACAAAVRAYDAVRGKGPSVVPDGIDEDA